MLRIFRIADPPQSTKLGKRRLPARIIEFEDELNLQIPVDPLQNLSLNLRPVAPRSAGLDPEFDTRKLNAPHIHQIRGEPSQARSGHRNSGIGKLTQRIPGLGSGKFNPVSNFEKGYNIYTPEI
jgi:hypothetical protein